MERKDIVADMDKILSQVKKIYKERVFGMGITQVYYAGGTLCIDIYEKCAFKFLVMVNISTESFEISDAESGTFHKGLLDMKSLRLAFGIYEDKKGKTKYYDECFGNSCLRHLA
jgi:hypothetical protein